jgi:ABC-2 type transport system ATP-binding protein
MLILTTNIDSIIKNFIMSDQTLAIKAVNLNRKFKDKQAINNLSLEVKKGEIYAFLGPNGAGKSTTIKLLVTLLDSTSGDIFINGVNLHNNPLQARLSIGVALQEASLDESQTGIEFLYLQGRIYGLGNKEIKNRISELLPLIDIGDAIKKQIKTYSGGMKRRLDLAAAIFHKPSILFLDEPTTGLDPISRTKVWNEVKRLNTELGVTIFLTTQYLEEADQLANRVGIINDGKLVAEGTPAELKSQIGNDLIVVQIKEISNDVIERLQKISNVSKVEKLENELRISSTNGSSVIGKIALELDNSQINIDSMTLRTTSLDDVFLEVTGNRLNKKDE